MTQRQEALKSAQFFCNENRREMIFYLDANPWLSSEGPRYSYDYFTKSNLGYLNSAGRFSRLVRIKPEE